MTTTRLLIRRDAIRPGDVPDDLTIGSIVVASVGGGPEALYEVTRLDEYVEFTRPEVLDR